MNIKSLFVTTSMAVVGLAFVACSHDDFINEDAPVNNLKAEYATNFEQKYGKIAPNQSWDFCSMQPTYSLPSTTLTNGARTRGNTFNRTKETMEIGDTFIQYMADNMKEGKNNTTHGYPFGMKVPSNAFTVVPIFQGYARYYWQIWMHVDGIGDQQVWEKGEEFLYKENETDEWTPVGTGLDGIKNKKGHFVKAPAYTYNDLPAGEKMYFYIKVWKNGSFNLGIQRYEKYLEDPSNPNYQPYICSSLNQQMLALKDAPLDGLNIGADNEVTIIGCEDMLKSEIGSSDYDYEDLVFMVYGNPVPPTEEVEELIESQTKRYMMEDLGTTDDFDFNDVVVDVKTGRKIVYKYEFDTEGNKSLVSTTETRLPDQAIVRAAGGTMDFTLTIGSTTWTKSEHMSSSVMWNTGWGGASIDYKAVLDEPFEVKDFNPATNNVSVSVVGNSGFEGVKTITFPKLGEAPMMIAVDPDVKWMKERQSIPTSWFTVPE